MRRHKVLAGMAMLLAMLLACTAQARLLSADSAMTDTNSALQVDVNRAATANIASVHWSNFQTGNEATHLTQLQPRYYDSLLGVFLSKDPEPVSTEDGSNFNRYNYANNNPYKYIDPDGREFKFAAGSSDQFKNDIGQMRSYLAKGGVDGPLKAIDRSTTTILLQDASKTNDMHFDPNSMTIVIDPRSALEVGPGQIQTPALGLLHEAAHAEREITDPAGKAADKAAPDGAYRNKEERRVVEKIESPAANKLREPTRDNIGGKPKQVECATCTK